MSLSLLLILTISMGALAQVPASSPSPSVSPTVAPSPSPSPPITSSATALLADNPPDSAEFLDYGSASFVPNLLIAKPVSHLFTGNASMTMPISLPRARGNVTPLVFLQYGSGSGSSWVGTGWEMQFGNIERNTRFGLNYDANEF